MRVRAYSTALVVLSMLATMTAAAQPDVTMTLDATPDRAQVGDVIRLEVRVRVRGGDIEGLELKDLRKYPELQIISHQTMRPMQFSFGFGSGVQTESSLAHIYMLRATAEGTYEFSPALAKVDGKTYESEPLTIVVSGGGSVPSQPSEPGIAPPPSDQPGDDLSGAKFDARAFLRTVVEPEEAYVGQQINVTVYLYTRLRLGPQSLTPTKPPMDGFWVYDDPITSLQAQTVTVRGLRYQVYPLIRSAAFPQRAGELTLGSPKVSFDVGRMSFFDAPERIEREGIPVTVRVKPLPSPAPPNAVVGQYDIEARLDRTAVATGDAVTLSIDAGGVGNVQALRIDLPPIAGVRTLQPAIRDRQSLNAGQLSGTRSWEWILIAETPGEHTIPPLELHYFDPESEAYGTVSTDALTFTATGEAKRAEPLIAPASPEPKPAPAEFGPIRMYSSLARGHSPVRSLAWFGWALAIPPLGFILVVIAVNASRRRAQGSTEASAVQRKLLRSAREALEAGDPRTFYDRIVQGITHALDSRLGEPVGGLPHGELRARLAAAGFDTDLVDRIINELEGADFARFAASGVDRDEMERCLKRTTAIIERAESAKGIT
jgi:hypothetical protein